MAADIGARIGIDGEAQFRSALRIINSDLRVLGTELQAVASQFDRTDRSEQNLTQQNQVLVRSIETQRQHITLLNTELGRQSDNLSRLGRDLETARASGENNATAVAAAERAYANQVVVVNRLQTEMNRATTGLNTMERQLTNNQQALSEMGDSTNTATNSLGDLRTRFTEFGQSAAAGCKIAAAAIGTIAVAVGGAAAAAMQFGDDFKKSLNSLQSETGATEKEVQGFSDTMKAVYANNFGEDFQDIASAIGTIKQQIGGKWSTQELQKVTENALMMRDTFEFEVSESVRAVDMMMKQFGVTSDEAYTLIAQGAQKGLDKNDSLLDSVNEYSVHFKQLGFDSEEMFNMFANGAQSGVFDIDKLGDAVKEFGIRAKDGSTATTEAYDLLGLSAEDLQAKFLAGGDSAQGAFGEVITALSACDSEVVRNTAGVNLFGTMWEDMGTEAVMALSNTNGAISITADSLEQINRVKYDSLGETFTGIGRMLQTELLFPISDKLLPTFTDMADKLKTALASEEIQNGIDTITESIANLAGSMVDFVSNQLSNLIESFAWIIDHGSEIATAIVAVGAAFTTIKLSALVTGITGFVSSLIGAGGLTAALSLIGTTIAGLGTTILGILGGPVTLIVAAIAAVGAGLLTLWNTNEGFRNAVIAAWTAVCDAASTIWNGVVVLFTETLPQAIQSALAFFQGIPAMFGMVWDGIGAIFQSGWEAIVSFFTVSIPNWITSMGDMFNQLPYLLGDILGNALATVADWGANLINWVTTTVPQIIESIVKFFAELPGKIWTWLVNTVNKVAEWGTEMSAKAKTGATNAVNSAITAIQELPGKIWTLLLETIQKVTAWGTQMISAGKTNAAAFVTNTVAALKALPGRVVSIGSDTLKGIWEGFTNMTEWVQGKITDWCGSFVQGFKDALGIKSPSREFRDLIGTNIVLGIDEGIKKTEPKVIKTIEELSQYMLEQAGQWVDGKKQLNALNVEDEIAFWEDMKTIGELQSAELIEIDKKIAEARVNLSKSSLDHSKKWIDEQKFYNQLSGEEEIESWKRILANKNILSEERVAAQKSLYTAEQNILKEQQKAYDEYEKNLESRTKSLSSFAGLFSKIEEKNEVTGKELLSNLQGQVAAFKNWQQSMENLESRGISDALLKELQGLGVKAAEEIQALTNLSDAELDEYVALYAQKGKLAAEQAQKEIGSIGIPVNLVMEEDSKTLNGNSEEGMTQSAKAMIETFQKGVLDNSETVKLTGDTMVKALVNGIVSCKPVLTTTVTNISLETLAIINNFRDAFLTTGINLTTGLWEGIESKRSWLLNNIVDMLEEAVRAAKEAMDIHSPSRVWAGIGQNMAAGLGEGFLNEMQIVAKDINASIPTPTVELSSLNRGSKSGARKTDSKNAGVNIIQNIYSPTPSPRQEQRAAARELKKVGVMVGLS